MGRMAYGGYALLTLVSVFFAQSDTTAGQSNEQQIYTKIFTGYNTNLRPLSNSSSAVTVKLKFELTKINDIDEVNQVMHVVGFYIAEWTDEYLVWNASDYGDVDRVVVPAKYIWVPDFAIVNSADVFYHTEFVNDFRVLIRNTGEIIWSFGGNIAVSCELDLTYYPFDQQMCMMKIENWQYTKSEVELVNSTSEIERDEFHTNGMWTVSSTESQAGIIFHQAFPSVPYPLIKFKIYLNRKSGYYVINILIPCLVLALVALLVFWLPPDSGEKIGLGITIILAFSVFALIIAETTPRTSDHYPLLSIWMATLIVVSTLSTMATIIVLYYHHHLPVRPPKYMRSILLQGLGRALCVGGIPRETGEDEVHDLKLDPGDTDSLVKHPITDDGVKSGQDQQLVQHVKLILAQLKLITKSITDTAKDSGYADEWMAVARVVDRLCFWINLVVIIVATIVCFSLRGSVSTTD